MVCLVSIFGHPPDKAKCHATGNSVKKEKNIPRNQTKLEQAHGIVLTPSFVASVLVTNTANLHSSEDARVACLHYEIFGKATLVIRAAVQS